MKKCTLIFISAAFILISMCFPVLAEYSTEYSQNVNYDAEFDESSVLVSMRQYWNDVSLFSTQVTSARMKFAGLGIADIENLDACSGNDVSLFSAGEERVVLKLTLEEPGRENVIETIEKLKELPEVEYAEPNYIYSLSSLPNDTYYVSGDQYWLNKINAPDVWAMDIDCSEMVVAVIDTGIMMNHPDLADNI